MTPQEEMLKAKIEESTQLFLQMKSLLEEHDFGVIMTVMTQIMVLVLSTYTEDDDQASETLSKFVNVIIEQLIEEAVCDCPKCTAKRRAMH